eukprot:673820-Amphidinium_carterae.1
MTAEARQRGEDLAKVVAAQKRAAEACMLVSKRESAILTKLFFLRTLVHSENSLVKLHAFRDTLADRKLQHCYHRHINHPRLNELQNPVPANVVTSTISYTSDVNN